MYPQTKYRRTRSRSMKHRFCPEGKILRKSYVRKSYVRADGTRVSQAHVRAECIEDRGLPGKGPQLIPKLKKGLLEKYGYHDVMHMSEKARHAALRKAAKAYGKNNLISKLNAVVVLNRNTNPSLSRRFEKDRDWVSKNISSKLKKSRSRSMSRTSKSKKSKSRKSKSKSKSRSRSRSRSRK